MLGVYMKKILALSRFEINILMDNKISFIFSLIFPVIYMAYNFIKFHHSGASESLFLFILPYLSYLIVTNVLYGWVANITAVRENNFLKVFSSIAGDKKYVFIAKFLITLISIFIQAELLAISLEFITRHVDLYLLLKIALITPLASFFLCSGLSILLLLSIRPQPLQLFLTVYLIGGMFFMGTQTHNLFFKILLNTLNAFSFIFNFGQVFVQSDRFSFYNIITLIIPIIMFLLLGVLSLSRIPVSSKFNRL